MYILTEVEVASIPADFLLVAQNTNSYKCLGFSTTGTPYAYDTDHSHYEGFGRYLPRTGTMQATEDLLRTQFFNKYYNTKIVELKLTRDKGKTLPIELEGVGTFDMDEAAAKNITTAITYFTEVMTSALSAGWTTPGTIPWVLADNSIVAVTQANLEQVAALAAARGMLLHLEYNTKKASLQAIRDSGGR